MSNFRIFRIYFNVAETKRISKKKVIAVLLIIFLFMLGALYIVRVSYPFVVNTASAKTRAATMQAINAASEKIRNLEAFYGNYYEFERSDTGEIVLMKVNSSQINRLNLMAQNEVQAELNKLEDFHLELHLGAYTGSAVLSQYGPTMKVYVKQVGTAVAEVRSEFYEEGINQTLHRLVLNISTTVDILLPVKGQDVEVSTQLILAENIIVGRVPDSYITGIGANDVLNLIP